MKKNGKRLVVCRFFSNFAAATTCDNDKYKISDFIEMAKKKKEAVCLIEGQYPGLFGQKHSNRDYRYEDSWGKNQFNSSFPASLIAYMSSLDMEPVYLCTNKKNKIVHKSISSTQLLGIDPLCDDAFYNFEAGYFPYEQYYTASDDKKKRKDRPRYV